MLSKSNNPVTSWASHVVDEKYDLVLFDLDNTLYDEYDFLTQVFTQISMSAASYGLVPSVVQLFLEQTLRLEGRNKLLQKMVQQFSLPSEFAESCYKIYQNPEGKVPLKPFAGVDEMLSKLTQNTRVLIWTNGNKEQQTLKLKLLRIDRYLNLGEDVLFANEFPKPSSQALMNFKDKSLFKHALFYGDRPIDEAAAAGANIEFAWVEVPVTLPRSI